MKTLTTDHSVIIPTVYRSSDIKKIGKEGYPAIAIRIGNITETELKVIAEALRTNTTIISLDISANNICAQGAKVIAEALKTNTTITSLNLKYNNICAQGAKYIAEALKNNTTLNSLDLQYNDIGEEGVKYIAKALRANTTITILDLSSNNICKEGAKAIAEALEANTSVTHINLDNSGTNTNNQYLKLIARYTSKEYIQENIKNSVDSIINLEWKGGNINNNISSELKQTLLKKLLHTNSKDLAGFYKNNAVDKTYNTYQQALIKQTGDTKLINGIFDKYNAFSNALVDFFRHVQSLDSNKTFELRVMKPSNESNSGKVTKFYENLANSPLNQVLDLLKALDVDKIIENIPTILDQDLHYYSSLKMSLENIDTALKDIIPVDPDIHALLKDIDILNIMERLQFEEIEVHELSVIKEARLSKEEEEEPQQENKIGTVNSNILSNQTFLSQLREQRDLEAQYNEQLQQEVEKQDQLENPNMPKDSINPSHSLDQQNEGAASNLPELMGEH